MAGQGSLENWTPSSGLYELSSLVAAGQQQVIMAGQCVIHGAPARACVGATSGDDALGMCLHCFGHLHVCVCTGVRGLVLGTGMYMCTFNVSVFMYV